MNEILILSAGRRVSLVRAFQQSAHLLGIRVVAADANPVMSSACHIADDRIKLPHVSSNSFENALLDYCLTHPVKLVVPTIDTELAKLAVLREALTAAGTTAVVSDRALIEICRDKRVTAEYFSKLGLASPEIYSTNAMTFPALVKPFDGSLSAGVRVLLADHDLTPELLSNPKNIFCQYLDPASYAEFTCDAYYDAKSRLRCVVPRLRIETRGGEVAKGKTERNAIIAYLFERIGMLDGARGCLTIQLMKHRQSGAIFLIEVNPRFGGGYPLTAQAGAAYHQWLIDEYVMGREIAIDDSWDDGLVMLRYDDAVFLPGR